jgi:hypothetical protein
MAWTTPRTWTSGELVTAAVMNSALRDNLSILDSGRLAITSQAARDILFASSSTQLARLAAGTSGLYLQTQGTGSDPVWASAGANQVLLLVPAANTPPVTNPSTFGLRNNVPCLFFDDSTDEFAIFPLLCMPAYGGGGLTVDVYWAATSATSGTGGWHAAIEGQDTDIDSDSFAANQSASTTTSGTSGIRVKTTIVFTDGSQMDSLAAGQIGRLRITRNTSVGSDVVGDLELYSVTVRET